MIAGAADANDWVKGGVEIDAGDGSQNSHLHWHVDLVRVGIERNLANFYVGQITSDAIYARTDYMNYITKQATYPGCTRGATDGTSGQPNWWCGLQVSQINAKMDATYGLLIFAAILNFVAWVLAQSINSGNVTVLSNPHAFKATTGLMAAACFFSFVAVCNFAGAGIKDGVCSGFDPVDPQNPSNNTYCDYSDGFRVAIFAVVFSLIQTVVMWFWVPHTGGSNCASTASLSPRHISKATHSV